MKTGPTSFMVSETLRTSVLRAQSALLKAQTEMGSGRVADAGLALGAGTGQLVSFGRQSGMLQAILDANGLVSSRLEASQAALQGASKTASGFQDALVAARAGNASPGVVAAQARDALRALAGALGTTFRGEHVFGGVNTGVPPLADYFGPSGSNARSAVGTAFSAAFGMTRSDPAVASLDAASVRQFLDGAFSSLFDDAGWKSDWSRAADEPLRSMIAVGEAVDVSVGANEPALRKLAMAYTMLADLGAGGMNESAYQAVLDKATATMGEAFQGLTALQAGLGLTLARVQAASERITVQQGILAKATGAMVDVDPYEAASRVNELRTQLETAYALTKRLQDLSLVKFL